MIGELGPQLSNVATDPAALRERVAVDIRRNLADEAGISRDDRERLAGEIADDILGYGPLERLLADDTITEIMVNGPDEIWIERQGRLYETTVRFTDESHLRRIINKMVAQVGRRVDESSPMVDARLPGRQPRQRDHPAAVALGPAADDPEVLAEAADARRHAAASARSSEEAVDVPRSAASRPSSTSSSRAARAPARRRC